jgi:lipocalin
VCRRGIICHLNLHLNGTTEDAASARRATMLLSSLLALAPLAFPSSSSSSSCPPVSTVGSDNLNLTEWTRKTWFIQQQQVCEYLKPKDFFCVAATYDLGGKTVPLFDGTVVSVHNYANVGEVNGPNENSGNATLCARAADKDDTSKLSVAPCFLPNVFAGPYWILGIGKDGDGAYEWAVVIGGEPTVKWEDGCSTKETGVNNAGLWLFSRAPVASNSSIAAMHSLLEAQGVARSRLQPVAQAGCEYKGAILK